MNCLIVDDDEIARAVVKLCVERTEFLNLIAECSKAMDAVEIMKRHKIDLIFLDVEMPGMTGIDFIKTFPEIPQIILVTRKKEYAAEAFDYNVTDYIVKPVDHTRFLKAALKAKTINENISASPHGNGDIFIKKDSGIIKLNIREISWIQALADYVTIYTNGERHTILSTMKSIEVKLPVKEFARVHRSYIVRLDKIKAIKQNKLTISDQIIPISRFYRDNLFSKLKLG